MLSLKGNILLVGGTGFLARGLLRRCVNENWPIENITIYSRNEHFQAECKNRYPEFEYVLGDIRDNDKLSIICRYQDVVINCAALKYVPESEFNVSECLDINVMGVKSLLSACYSSKRVRTVVGISTDKAVEPANMYGLTKAIGEKLYCEMASWLVWENRIKFVQTRYGNVIGSTGSVVPLFKRMYEQTGSVKVTDTTMTRFWLTIDEAVDLILQAVNELNSGEIIVPNLRACSLATVIEAVVPNAKIKIIGLRPGEKLHEKLLTKLESSKSKEIVMASQGGYTYGYVYNPLAVSVDTSNSEVVSSDPSSWISANEFHEAVEDAARV